MLSDFANICVDQDLDPKTTGTRSLYISPSRAGNVSSVSQSQHQLIQNNFSDRVVTDPDKKKT